MSFDDCHTNRFYERKEPWWSKALGPIAGIMAGLILMVVVLSMLYYSLDAMGQVHPNRRCPVLDKFIDPTK